MRFCIDTTLWRYGDTSKLGWWKLLFFLKTAKKCIPSAFSWNRTTLVYFRVESNICFPLFADVLKTNKTVCKGTELCTSKFEFMKKYISFFYNTDNYTIVVLACTFNTLFALFFCFIEFQKVSCKMTPILELLLYSAGSFFNLGRKIQTENPQIVAESNRMLLSHNAFPVNSLSHLNRR